MRRAAVLAPLALAVVFMGAASSVARAETPIPPAPDAWVTDHAAFLTPPAVADLDARLGDYARRTGHQVLVYIDHTTGGVPIEDWGVRAFERWRVGRRGIDDGLLLLVFADDHHVRFEVGYGLEDRVPDAVAKRIIEEQILPRIRAGDRDGAIRAGVAAVTTVIGGAVGTAPGVVEQPARAPIPVWMLIVGGVVFVLFIGFAVTHPSLAWLMLLSIGSGRGGGGGGFGGGGFSGGGGRSGGGGASGVVVSGRSKVHGIDLAAVERAIGAAERATTGEIRVALCRFYFWGDVRRAAERAFARLGIARTREHNGVLIFVAPWRRRFTILGDEGIHCRVEGGFWDATASTLAQAFHAGDLTSGLVHAIEVIGARLAVHFPVPPGTDGNPHDNPNELSDRVARGRQR